MLYQKLRRIFSILVKLLLWIVMGCTAIPFVIFVLLLNLFPEFTSEADTWFWIAFIPLNIVAYYYLWKPIVWVITTISGLGKGME